MKNGEKRIEVEGFIIREDLYDKTNDLISDEGYQSIKKQIKIGDHIFYNFQCTKPPIGIVKSIEDIPGTGIKIKAEVNIDRQIMDEHMFTISGSYIDVEKLDDINIINDIDLWGISIIPKCMSPYEEE